MKRYIRIFLILSVSLSFVGCASFGKSLKEFLGGKESVQKKQASAKKYGKIDKKKYKKVKHVSLQDQSELGANSGSLWIERGQGAYYFHQNTNRLIGDLINVEIEGGPKEQIETKVKVIQDLIDRIKKQRAARKLAKAGPAGAAGAAPAPAAPAASGGGGSKEKFNVKLVPTRIVEVLKDGSYRIQGDQTFMIGKRDYKLVVTGIVRQEDFDDQGISAETLLDPKFDIVTAKKGKG